MPLVYRAEVHIPAPVEAVWGVLRDFDRYEEWNTFNPGARTTGIVGDPIALTVTLRGRRVAQTETVRELTEPSRLVWGFSRGPVLWAERVQTIAPAEGGAHYVTVDTIGGLLSPIVGWLYGSSLQDGFQQMAADLQRRVSNFGGFSE